MKVIRLLWNPQLHWELYLSKHKRKSNLSVTLNASIKANIYKNTVSTFCRRASPLSYWKGMCESLWKQSVLGTLPPWIVQNSVIIQIWPGHKSKHVLQNIIYIHTEKMTSVTLACERLNREGVMARLYIKTELWPIICSDQSGKPNHSLYSYWA